MPFAVTTINTDRSLLTLAELRAAAGVTDGSMDTALQTMGLRISASITKVCNVVRDGVTPPTLRLESVSDTIELDRCERFILLSRFPIVSVLSGVTENGIALTSADYRIHAADGRLERRSAASRSKWAACCDIYVPYEAGYDVVDDDLKLAAVKYVQAEVRGDGRDPLLKSKTTEGVSSYEWWVDPTRDSIVPAEVMDILQRGGFVNPLVAR